MESQIQSEERETKEQRYSKASGLGETWHERRNIASNYEISRPLQW